MKKCLKHWPSSIAHTRAFKCLTAFGGVVADEKMVKDMMNEALNRMKQKNGWNDEETLEQFGVFVQANFPEIWEAAGKKVTALDEEDFDFFSASWEVTETRRGSSGKGEEWVGMLIGYDGERDTMERQRNLAVESARANISQTLRYGIKMNERIIKIGRCFERDGKWHIVDGNDTTIHTEDAKAEKPRWVIPLDASNICLLRDDNKPKTAYMPKRTWLFVGNRKASFMEEGPLPEIMPLECSFGAADVDLQLLRPITFKAEMESAWNDENRKILKALDIAPDYGLDWVDEANLATATRMFSPDQYLAQFTPVVDLGEVFDYHMQHRVILQSGRDFGPIFAVTGVVDYIDHDGKENQYTEGGYKHALTIASQSLRRDDPNASMWVDVSRRLVNDHHAFKVKKADGWHDYTKGSRVWAIVRTRSWEATSGDLNINMDAKAVYAMPLRSIVAPKIDADVNSLSHLDMGYDQ